MLYVGIVIVAIIVIIIIGKVLSALEEILKVILYPISLMIRFIKFILKK